MGSRDANGEWRGLHNEELHSLYPSSNINRVLYSRRLRWVGHVARMEEGNVFKPTGKKTFREYNFGMDLKEIGVNYEGLG